VSTNLVLNSQRVGVAPGRVKRCGRCRREYALDSWERLELIEWMVADTIRRLVTSWPREVAIEIRRCSVCGALIARKKDPEAQRR
jgi:hypothetical protein